MVIVLKTIWIVRRTPVGGLRRWRYCFTKDHKRMGVAYVLKAVSSKKLEQHLPHGKTNRGAQMRPFWGADFWDQRTIQTFQKFVPSLRCKPLKFSNTMRKIHEFKWTTPKRLKPRNWHDFQRLFLQSPTSFKKILDHRPNLKCFQVSPIINMIWL